MRLVISWLRDFVNIEASAHDIAGKLGVRGFEVAAVEELPGDDAVIDFEVTANRPDCLSVLGLAREVATAFQLPLSPSHATALASVPVGDSDRIRVAIDDAELGPRYAAAVAEVTNVASPAWMTSRLEAAGVRPISAIVDVTNYVLLELGHPMHAFDLAKLAGSEIRVRRAKAGSTIRTLDGVDRKLDEEMLVIADRDRAQAIAGVMGGAASEVSRDTTAVVFESAYFKPSSVRRTSKRLLLKTEASARFERGADINAAVTALQRAIALMAFIGAGKVSGPIVDRYPNPRGPVTVPLRRARLASLLGVSVPDAEVSRILRSLGFDVAATADGWAVTAPTFRVDVTREVDLIEEVGRHFGFDKVPDTFPALKAAAAPADPRIRRDQLVRRVLTAAGLSEAVTFGFIEARAAQPFAEPAAIVGVANPLSAKFDTLRPSLIPGLIDAVARNRRHGREDVALFELGTRFSADGETRAVGLAWTGAGSPPHWSSPSRGVDFFDIKGVVERLCEALAVDVAFRPSDAPFYVPGRAAVVLAGDRPLGVLGQIVPAIADTRGAPKNDDLFAAELNLDALAESARPRDESVRALPRFPFVVRDLSIIVDDVLPAEIIRGTIQAAAAGAAAPLVNVAVFDRYQGKGVPEGRVSLSVRLTFQADDRTLTDAEVQRSVDLILAALMERHSAVQR